MRMSSTVYFLCRRRMLLHPIWMDLDIKSGFHLTNRFGVAKIISTVVLSTIM